MRTSAAVCAITAPPEGWNGASDVPSGSLRCFPDPNDFANPYSVHHARTDDRRCEAQRGRVDARDAAAGNDVAEADGDGGRDVSRQRNEVPEFHRDPPAAGYRIGAGGV